MFECNRRSKADTANGILIFYGSDVYAPINKIATAESIQLCERRGYPSILFSFVPEKFLVVFAQREKLLLAWSDLE